MRLPALTACEYTMSFSNSIVFFMCFWVNKSAKVNSFNAKGGTFILKKQEKGGFLFFLCENKCFMIAPEMKMSVLATL